MRLRAVLAAATATLAALAGCAAPPPPAAPDVSVVVYQPRTDVTGGRLAIQVHNGAATPLEVVAARLSSPDFAHDAVWPGDGVTIPAGARIDLRAPIPEFACEAHPDAVATIEVRTEQGIRQVELGADDPFDLLPRLHSAWCVAAEIAEIAVVTPREVVVPEGRGAAVLVLDVAPTGAPGVVHLEAVSGTTLLQPAIDGRATDRLVLEIALGADGPAQVRIPFVPNRCDAHALAEDKVGTIIPFTVTTPATRSVRWTLAVTEEQRGVFGAYWTAYCGFPTG